MNKYNKKKKIGEGSFGKALLVVCKETGKEYVIKEINISKMKRKEREESKKEVAVLRKMKHPNIVSYQDSFEEVGNLYIVMDFCDGGDLYKAINGRRGVLFPEDQVLDWFVQICLAIKHVHDRKILHRDIKSQNIFLTKKGIVKLGDFGIARVLNSTVELARTCIGTPYYLSPEICENKPYNNKSDIWALGCVLYEICTLKHAFEAGNMKNLVLKIIRGSYPPVSPRYSYDLRNLIALLFKRNARDRPSVNTILKKPFIQRRIEKFLSDTEMADEFSHTILHRNQAPGPYGAAGRPAFAAERKPYQPVRLSDPSSKYGPSVGMRKPPAPVRKPVEKRKEPSQPPKPAVNLEKQRRERIEKERARQIKERQVRVNNQQKLVDKQRLQHINKAREAGWRHTLSSGSGGSNGVENDGQLNDEPPAKEPRMELENKPKPEAKPFKPLQERGNYDNYHKYLDNLRANMHGAEAGQGGAAMFRREARQKAWPDEDAVRQNIRDRPVSASAAEAARRGEMARNAGAEAAGRAKLVEDFLSNKRAAAANKARAAINPINAYGPSPAYNQPAPAVAPFAGEVKGRNQQEEEYLERLKAIRMQNFQERRNLKIAAAGGKAVKASMEAEVRRKKIEALKAQADEKASKIKEQLEKQRREAYEKEKKSWEEHLAKKRGQDVKRPTSVPAKGPAAAVVPLTAVLKDVGCDLMPAEAPALKEEALSKPAMPEKEQGGDRKKWGGGKMAINLGNLPLQETASGMEATGAGDMVTLNTGAPPRGKAAGGGGGGGGGGLGGGVKGVFGPPPPLPQGRKKWGGPAQTALNALQQADIVPGTTTLETSKQPDKGGSPMGVTIVKDQPSPRKLPIAKGTITISDAAKKGKDNVDGGAIETIDAKETSATKLSPGTDRPSKPRSAWDKSPRSTPLPPDTPTSPSTPSTPSEETEQTLKAPSSPLKPASPGAAASTSPDKASSPEGAQTSPAKTSSPRKSPSPVKTSSPPADKTSKGEDQVDAGRGTETGTGEEKKSLVGQVELESDEDEEADLSLYKTANRSDVLEGLETGNFDTDAKILRTCSMPDLSKLFRTTLALNPFFEVEKQTMEIAARTMELELADLQARDVAAAGGDDDNDDDDDDDLDEEDECDIIEDLDDEADDGGDEADGDDEEYRSLVESMKSILEATDAEDQARSIQDGGQGSPGGSDERSSTSSSPVGAEGGEDEDADENESEESKPINEDWDSGDGTDGEEDKESESLFSRLEESRLHLEKELGCDTFLKAYKSIQAIHEDEDEDIEQGTKVIGSILAKDQEHLYTKILQLVMADGAYTEDND